MRDLVDKTAPITGLACLHGKGKIVVWNLHDRRPRQWSAPANVKLLAFHPAGKWLATAGRDIQLWNAETGALLVRLDPHTQKVNALSFSGDGRFLLSGSDDQTVRSIDMEELEQQLGKLHLGDVPVR